jgi:hypothetical protein
MEEAGSGGILRPHKKGWSGCSEASPLDCIARAIAPAIEGVFCIPIKKSQLGAASPSHVGLARLSPQYARGRNPGRIFVPQKRQPEPSSAAAYTSGKLRGRHAFVVGKISRYLLRPSLDQAAWSRPHRRVSTASVKRVRLRFSRSQVAYSRVITQA